jgi:serine/threonine-protein kinase RsbW
MIRLRVPGSLGHRELALRLVHAACGLCGAGRPRHGDFEAQVLSAFGEAFNNVAIHGFRDLPVGDVEIEIDPREAGIHIRMSDFGASFDLAQVPAPDLDSLPESGLGIYIMRSFMDDVTYQPGRPNVLSLTKSLPALVDRPDRPQAAAHAARQHTR